MLINVNNLEKTFAAKTLFKSVSFGINEKEKVGLIGPNGAGKSTLLKILAGRDRPDRGDVTPKRGLQIGFLEQTPLFAKDDTIMSALLSKAHDPHDSMALAYEWMARLDLNQFDEDFPVAKLSGGWKKKVALGRELVLSPELLFMDEPTNHLDISSILWLEEFLKAAPFAFLMITHDRLFLQRTADRILDLDSKNPNYLLSVQGDYVQYLETKEQLLEAQQKLEKVLKNTLRRETEWLRRGAKARQTKQKARIESAHSLKADVESLTHKNRQNRVGIDFSEESRTPNKLIEAINISKTYGTATLFENLDVLITGKTRLALIGDNGCGKSTLIKTLIGEVTPDRGTVKITDKIKINYFEQGRESLKPHLSVLKNVCPEGDYVSFKGQHVYARSYLERFLFFANTADLPVEKLSGGEQARLRIAQMMLQDAQVLILDEPTNDLDIQTLEVLEESLQDFNGAVLLVTHDRYFMDAVCQEMLAFYVTEENDRILQKFSSYLQYEAWLDEQSEARKSKSAANRPNKGKETTKTKLSFNEKFELDGIEEKILKAEDQLTGLQKDLESPETVSSSSRLIEITQAISKLEHEIEAMYLRWSVLEKK